jgi:hypothetical protein
MIPQTQKAHWKPPVSATSVVAAADAGEVSRIVFFNDPGLFTVFGFASRLPSGEREPVPCGG